MVRTILKPASWLSPVLLLASVASANPVVRPGIQQLLSDPWIHEIEGKRVGVLAHHVSRTVDGTHLIDLLFKRADVKVGAIFAPEHGIRGTEDVPLPDGSDSVTGLPVFSLYGPRKAPSPDQLALIDVVVIDLQDVGVRYYTYAATMALTMQACKAAGKKVIVLDRPNPIGGEVVEGAVLEQDMQGSIAAFYPIATRHGMTLGELARLSNDSFGIGADLTVVPMVGWDRSMYWEDTGLPWVGPSPALPTVEQAFLYGFLGPLESLELAVGRGIRNPEAFRIYGAPSITATQSSRLAAALNALNLPGLSFSRAQWTPDRSNFLGRLCRGFRVTVTDRSKVDGLRSLVEVMKTMRRILGARFDLRQADAMLGTHWLRDAIERRLSTQSILARIRTESAAFLNQRDKALIY